MLAVNRYAEIMNSYADNLPGQFWCRTKRTDNLSAYGRKGLLPDGQRTRTKSKD